VPAIALRENRLSEDEVVLATLAPHRSEGISRPSMRRLASQLGVNPMAIYYDARSQEQLLMPVSARLLREIGEDDFGAWQERLLEDGTRMWDV